MAKLGAFRLELLLGLGKTLLVLLEDGDVGVDTDKAAILGAALLDVQPAPVLDLRLIVAAIDLPEVDVDALPHDRLGGGFDHCVIGRTWTNGILGKSMKLLIF